QMPAAIARMPTTTGSTVVRVCSGGSANQNANRPSTIPTIPTVLAPAIPFDAGRATVAVTRTASAAAVPDGEPAEVQADEEHDEPLDDRRQVAGELGREDRRVEPAPGRAVGQAAAEQRAETDADCGVPSEERRCEAEEADLRDLDVARTDLILPAED